MFELIFNQSLEEFFYLTMGIFYIVGMVFCFVGVPFIIYFWKRKIPKAARTLIHSAWKREPPLLLCHDSGRGELTTIRERKGEGIVMTAQNKYKILPRWRAKAPLSQMLGLKQQPEMPAPVTEGEDQVDPQKESLQQNGKSQVEGIERITRRNEIDLQTVFNVKLLHDNFILDYSDWIVKRTFLVGLDLPFFVGYTGKLCLLNPEALALYEAGDMMIKTEDQVLFNPKKIEGKTMADAFQPLLLLDSRKIQQIIYEGFDQSQIAGVVADSEELARIGQGLSSKMKLILGIIVIVCIAAAAIFLLPQIMGGSQGKQPSEQTPQAIFGLIKRFLRM